MLKNSSLKRYSAQIRIAILFFLLSSVTLFTYGQKSFWSVSSIEGNHNAGFIYKTDEEGRNFQIVHHFTGGINGENPHGNLIQGNDGKLYGVAFGGTDTGGILYSIHIQDNSFQVLHNFENDGPEGSIFMGSNGNIYGFEGTGFGSLFEYDLNSNQLNWLHAFNNTEGRIGSMLTEITPNVLLGVTRRGGFGDSGVIFKYDLNTSNYTVLFELEGTGVGFHPMSVVPFTQNKVLITTEGRWGSIFEFDYTTNQAALIFEFPSGTNSLVPDVLYADDGNFYGTTKIDGDGGHGSIFRYNPNSNTYTTLHDFYFGSEPHIPETPLVQGSNGKLYGTTTYVSAANAGTLIYEFDTQTENLVVTTSDSQGASLHKLLEVDENLTLSSQSYSLKENITIYPNPVQDQLHIDVGNLKNISIQLTTLQGRIIYFEEVNSTSVSIPFQFSSGIYLLEISNKIQKLQKKIIKM